MFSPELLSTAARKAIWLLLAVSMPVAAAQPSEPGRIGSTAPAVLLAAVASGDSAAVPAPGSVSPTAAARAVAPPAEVTASIIAHKQDGKAPDAGDHAAKTGAPKRENGPAYLPNYVAPTPVASPGSSRLSVVLAGSLLLLLLSAVGYAWYWRRTVAVAPRRPNPGRMAMLWLGPHVLMGLWLIAVPDTVSFTTNQLIVLVHVVLGLGTLPVILWFSIRHIRKTWSALTGPGHAGTSGKLGSMIAVLGAMISGVWVLWYGEGMPAATVHLWFGAACAVALLLHVTTLSLRQLAKAMTVALLGAAAFAGIVTLLVPAEPWEPFKPAFAYTERPLDLYDSAEWCGSCHKEFFDEWKSSVHGSTFKGHEVQHEQLPFQHKGFFKFGLADAGKIVKGERGEAGKPGEPPAMFATCSHCHSPTLYYGQASEGPFGAPAPISDGVTCSFCHTLRDVRDGGDSLASARKPEADPTHVEVDLAKAYQIVPFYVSAPETVRRYLGQNSRDPVARWVGDKLINWWPEMHRRDYHSKFLNTSQVCQGCHGFGIDATIHGTFIDWRSSRFAKGKAEEVVNCQDCHMAREMTGKPVSEPGRHVDWGPVRPRRTTHLFTGGNAEWSAKYASPAVAEHQRKWNSKSIEVEVISARQGADAVDVTVQVRTPLIAHNFPSMETVLRYAWVEVQALDASGAVVVRTKPWLGGNFSPALFAEAADPANKVPASPLIYRSEGYPHDGSVNTVMPADGKRDFAVRLPTGADTARIVKVAAQVYHSWDKQALARTEGSVAPGATP